MSIDSLITSVSYLGNASTLTPYPVPFPYMDAGHVKVQVGTAGTGTVISADGVATFSTAQDDLLPGHHVVVGGTDYTVMTRVSSTIFGLSPADTFASAPWHNRSLSVDLAAGNYTVSAAGVKTATAVPVTSLVTVYRQTAIVQPVDIPEAGAFPARAVEGALDRLTMIAQERADGTSAYSAVGGQDKAVFADEAARVTAKPGWAGQLGVQLDDATIWIAQSTAIGDWLEYTTQVVASDNFIPVSGTFTGLDGGNYMATAANTSLVIPTAAKPGSKYVLTSDTEGTVKFTIPAGWRVIYPDGSEVGIPVANGHGSRIVAEVVQPGIVKVSGETAPVYWNWHPSADSSLIMACKAGVHCKHSRIGWEGSASEVLGYEYIPRWGSLFGSGALIYPPSSNSAADFMPKIQDDVNFIGRRSLLMNDGSTDRSYMASVLPTGNSLSFHLAFRCLIAPNTATPVVSVGGASMNAGVGWASNTVEGLSYINSTYRYQALDNGVPVAYASKPAAAGLEETTDAILLSVERAASGAWTVYSGETLVSAATGSSSGLATIGLIRIKTGIQMQLAGFAMHNGVPASAAARVTRQKFYRSLFIA